MATQAEEVGVQLTGRELRWLADNYEQAQQMRIETGERIRAVVQGRDETFVPRGEIVEPGETEDDEARWRPAAGEVALTADETLKAIERGETRGPVPMLGRAYHRYATEEKETRRDMDRALQEHPAWNAWLVDVRGVGPTLACKLLARIDPRKAPHASSVWKYCGLATVPGERYECEVCGLRRGWPVGYNVSGRHEALSDVPVQVRAELPDGQAMTVEVDGTPDPEALDAAVAEVLDATQPELLPEEPEDVVEEADAVVEAAVNHLSSAKPGTEGQWLTTVGEVEFAVRQRVKAGSRCSGQLERVAGPDDGVRVAQPKPSRGEQASYDQYAKKICYLIGTSFLKVGGPYEEFYRRERRKADEERPGWKDGRKHHKALRKTEKLFLSHLWQVWREELGLPTGEPYAVSELGHEAESLIRPEDMTGDQELPAR